MRTCLIVPGYEGAVASMHPPLGLLTLRSALKAHAGWDASILDGLRYSEAVVQKLSSQYDLVGLQVHSLNVRESLQFACALRRLGSKVVVGGPEVTLSEDLSWAEGAYDIAVRGDIDLRTVEALVRTLSSTGTASQIVRGGKHLIDSIDYSGLTLDTYWRRAAKIGKKYRHAPIITHLGCTFRDRTRGGCTFCANIGQTTWVRGIQAINEEVSQLSSLYGVREFYCVGENLAAGMARSLAKHIALPPQAGWSFFSRADEITPRCVENLVTLGVREIRLGAESGDAAILASTAKGESLSSIEKAIRLLDAARIQTTLSFILGLPGETSDSLSRTCALAEVWSESYPTIQVSASAILPLPGSELGRMAGVKPGRGISVADSKRFVDQFTFARWEDVENAGSRIASLRRAASPASTVVIAPWRPKSETTRHHDPAQCA